MKQKIGFIGLGLIGGSIAKAVWEEIDFEDRRQVADGLISQIRATDEHVSIEWKI